MLRLSTSARIRLGLMALAVASFATVGVVTYIRVPSDTDYYGSNELYRWRTGEAERQTQERLFRSAVLALADQPPGAVMTFRAANYYTRWPLVRGPLRDGDLLRSVVDDHDVLYIVDGVEKEAFYQSSLPHEVIYRNAGFSTLPVWPSDADR